MGDSSFQAHMHSAAQYGWLAIKIALTLFPHFNPPHKACS